MEYLYNDFQAQLASAIPDALTTTIIVVSPAPVSQVPNYRIRIDDEYMLVTSHGAGLNWTVQRGIEGSVAVAHASGAAVTHVVTALGITQRVTDLVAAGTLAAAFTGLTVSGASALGNVTATKVLSTQGMNVGNAGGLGLFSGAVPETGNLVGYMAVSGGNGVVWLNSTGYFGISSLATDLNAIDARLYRGGAGVFEQRNGANAQAFRIYNTYIDASNYERAGLEWDANSLRLRTAAAGSGVSRSIFVQPASGASVFLDPSGGGGIYFSLSGLARWEVQGSTGNFIPFSDNATTLGHATARVRTGYFSASIILQGPTGFVNGFTLSSAAAGSSPTIAATGSDANIGIVLTPKGTGVVQIGANANAEVKFGDWTALVNGNTFAPSSNNYTRLGEDSRMWQRVLAIDYLMRSAANDPSVVDIPASGFVVWKNTNTGAVKLWANDAGAMKSVALA